MQRSFVIGGLALALAASASICAAASNLNSSKSNVYRAVYSPAVTAAQATAILTDLEKLGKSIDSAAVVDVAKKRGVRIGCGAGCINHVKVIGGTRILLLENPADEAQAIAVNDPGMPAEKPTKGKATK